MAEKAGWNCVQSTPHSVPIPTWNVDRSGNRASNFPSIERISTFVQWTAIDSAQILVDKDRHGRRRGSRSSLANDAYEARNAHAWWIAAPRARGKPRSCVTLLDPACLRGKRASRDSFSFDTRYDPSAPRLPSFLRPSTPRFLSRSTTSMFLLVLLFLRLLGALAHDGVCLGSAVFRCYLIHPSIPSFLRSRSIFDISLDLSLGFVTFIDNNTFVFRNKFSTTNLRENICTLFY